MTPAPEEVFELTGGALCLDLANTLDGRPRETPVERLGSYADLVAWAGLAGVVTPAEAARLGAAAAKHPRKARRALERARTVRETLFALFSAVAEGRQAPRPALEALNEVLPATLSRLRLFPAGGGFERRLVAAGDDLDRILPPVVLSAFDLLTSPRLARVTRCAAETCAWLFLDESKNRSRRWCDMKVCGNRAKARRHYRRTRG